MIKIQNELRKNIINQCDFLDENTLNTLDEILSNVFSKFKIQKSLKDNNDVILKKFIKAKALEGCSEITLQHYEKQCKYFVKFINKNLIDVETKDILNYLSYQKEKGNSAVTLNIKRGVLNSLYHWFINEGYLLVDPLKTIKKIRTPKKIKEHFTPREVEILRSAVYNIKTRKEIHLRNIAIFEVLLSSGIRASELCNLNISDVNFNECQMLINGKGNKQRIAYFNQKAKLAIENYLEVRKDNIDTLFASDRKKGEARLMVCSLDRTFRDIGKTVNIKVYPHKFRHTFATDLLEKGMPLEQVKTTLGHENIRTTQIYAKTSQKDIEMNHRRLIE